MNRKPRLKIRAVGETYRPKVVVAKVKKNIPTVLMISGRRYVYEPT